MGGLTVAHRPSSGNLPLFREAVDIATGRTRRRPTKAHCRALLRASIDVAAASELLLGAARRVTAETPVHRIGCVCPPCGLRQAVETIIGTV